MNLFREPRTIRASIAILGCITALSMPAQAYRDVNTKERRPYRKSIRTRMPPSIFHDWVRNELKAARPELRTDWQTFVVEDDPDAQDYLVIARSEERKWAFGVLREDCEKPENFEILKAQVKEGGTPVHVDIIIGIKKYRSFFRYTITVYEPMYPFWKSPCYVWNLPPGSKDDPFYSKNYTMAVYAGRLRDQIYDIISADAGDWRPPKKMQKIPAIKGPGQELIGEEAEILTDEEKKLPIEEQEKILKKRKKEQEKAEKLKKKSGKKEE